MCKPTESNVEKLGALKSIVVIHISYRYIKAEIKAYGAEKESSEKKKQV